MKKDRFLGMIRLYYIQKFKDFFYEKSLSCWLDSVFSYFNA
ncbi:hypothetical protein [Moraxella phage Mcat2]|uniref:Uncharacterized protein n=1 Tax=Moraxella catarrhalis TaxID=480 RepID=A0A3Q9GDG1_MORCA|nr:hypothetical protein [Moraxella phage Mcat2]AKI27075.1 hypothetical protein [Moraxella phage Mcat3]AKI27490.1 hypothetical protein [Moraxella phage Mcat11]AKI28318.1 hypothetical protein [Moraxella phage Mcat29]AZQ93052.1 hypothetical protein EJK53_1688 [Moraxella catarrhalis]